MNHLLFLHLLTVFENIFSLVIYSQFTANLKIYIYNIFFINLNFIYDNIYFSINIFQSVCRKYIQIEI